MLHTLLVLGLFSLIPTFFLVSATTVYLHRSATHMSVRFRPWVVWGWKALIWITGGPRDNQWVPVHRHHHSHSDLEGDPHSPYIEGFPQIQLGNVFYYVKWIEEHPDLVLKYSRDIRQRFSWWDRQVFSRPKLGIIFGTSFLCLMVGFYFHSVWIGIFGGVLAAFMHFIDYVFVLTPSINGLCHWPHQWLGGYQHKFEEGGEWHAVGHAVQTFNNWIVALFTGGEGLHYNHHWKQRSARFAKNWLELIADWGYWLWILPMKWLTLAYDVEVATWTP